MRLKGGRTDLTTAYRERRYFEMLLIFPLGTRRVNLGEASSGKWVWVRLGSVGVTI